MEIVKNATCTFCGCVCDDIELHAEDNKIVKAKNACSLGEAHFKFHDGGAPLSRCADRRQGSHGAEAVEFAADILYNANMPLGVRAQQRHV